MAEVLIDDSSLNDIANSLRTKNGLVRTYKPREMAPAIRALRDAIPSTHGYTVRIEQSPNQTICVDLYQDNQSHTYQQSFTVGEPLWRFQARVEPAAGYIAGILNYGGTYSINRDYLIQASPATRMNENITTVYMNGDRYGGGISQFSHYYFYSNYSCTTRITKTSIYGVVNVVDVSNGYPYTGRSLFGAESDTDRFVNATEIIQNVNVSEKRDLENAFRNCSYLKRVNISNWNPINVGSLSTFASGSPIEYFGDISGWYMPELITLNSAFSSNSKLGSLDLHDWYCPKLENCQSMFASDTKLRYVDISGLSTIVSANTNFVSSSNMFNGCDSLKYIIMDRQEVMFSGSGALFSNPHTRVKYLVPQEMVELYKAHSNWSSRASQIDAIENYTIDRYNGQVFVSESV